MDDRTEAKKRFDAIMKGRYVPKPVSLEEAKARVRATDPGIDISELLQALNEGDLRRAGTSVFRQALAPEAVAYFTPLILGTIESIVAATSGKKEKKA